MQLKILNTRGVKEIKELLEQQFGFTDTLNYVFLLTGKGKIYIANKEVFNIDLDKLNVSSIGLYFGEIEKDGLRLSIEGSQLVGPKAKKGVVEVDDYVGWMRGEDIDCDGEGYVIVKYHNDYLGSGRAKEGKVLNYVGKARRIN
jgi:NOL1/NOP2/fmu family ribosome biogenesis protein